jgi:hypothetical protein
VVRARLCLAALAASAITFDARGAAASDPERAAQLFREGRDAMAAHDYDLARRRFLESEQANPRVGTLINLAQCEEALERLAAPYRYWQQALDLARGLGDERRAYIEEQLARLGPRVPRLTIQLAPAAPPGTVVRRDGVDFAGASFGMALPVEPGTREILVVAPQHEPRTYSLVIAVGEQREIRVEPGAPVPSIDATPAPAAAPAAEAASSPAPAAPPAVRTVAYSAGVAGIVALGIGATYGVLAIQAAGDTSGHCNGDLCDAAGTAARNDEIAKAQVATAGLAVGAGLVATGAVLRVLSPSPDERPYVRRNLGYVVAATGLAGVVLGSVFGLKAIVDHRDADAGCAGGTCDARGVAARNDERGAVAGSVVGLAGGATLLAAGAAVALASRPGQTRVLHGLRLAPAIASGGAWLAAGGEW